jgi:UDP-N-acetylmuramate: L-alanyl-gamma-D-glutamyl-meso-diaminopimelate ligase
MELHTFSSLTKEFLVEYNGAMDDADTAIVFYKKETIEQKRLEPISEQEVKAAFQRDDLMVFTNSQELQDHLQSIEWNGKNLLFMSSGNFGGIDVEDFGPSLI